VHNTIKICILLDFGPSVRLYVPAFIVYPAGKTIKSSTAILHANNKQKMFTIFLKSGIITNKPSTEIEANNYDKTAS
jgi:hypothetical protein